MLSSALGRAFLKLLPLAKATGVDGVTELIVLYAALLPL
jgi:hypothetical protein